MIEEPKDRLRAARKNAGFESPDLAAAFYGFKPDTLKSHENGRRGISRNAASRYARAFKISESWLLTGENPPEWYSSKTMQNTTSILRTRQVPIISYTALLRIYKQEISLSSIMPNSEYILVPQRPGISPDVVALKIEFETNTDSISNGDIVSVDLNSEWEYGDYVFVLIDDEEILPMQVIEDTNSENKRVPFLKYLRDGRMPLELNKTNCRIIGRIYFRGHWL